MNWTMGVMIADIFCRIGLVFTAAERKGKVTNALLPLPLPSTLLLLEPKYLAAKYRATCPHIHSQSATLKIVALTCNTPRCVRYGLVSEWDNILAPPCQ